jgi:hypothetical protein
MRLNDDVEAKLARNRTRVEVALDRAYRVAVDHDEIRPGDLDAAARRRQREKRARIGAAHNPLRGDERAAAGSTGKLEGQVGEGRAECACIRFDRVARKGAAGRWVAVRSALAEAGCDRCSVTLVPGVEIAGVAIESRYEVRLSSLLPQCRQTRDSTDAGNVDGPMLRGREADDVDAERACIGPEAKRPARNHAALAPWYGSPRR